MEDAREDHGGSNVRPVVSFAPQRRNSFAARRGATFAAKRGKSFAAQRGKSFAAQRGASFASLRGNSFIESDPDLVRSGSLLCLHGRRSNNEVSKLQMKNLRLDMKFDIDYLRGSVVAPAAADQTTADFFHGPFYSWVEPGLPEGESVVQLIAALRYVINFVVKNGPYDVAYGFSTGGSIVGLLSMPMVLEYFGVSSPLWKSVIIACGSGPEYWTHMENVLGAEFPNGASQIPSLHLIAAEDMNKPDSEKFMLRFEDSRLRHVQYYGGGHGVPRELKNDQDIQSEIRYWLYNRSEESERFEPYVSTKAEASTLQYTLQQLKEDVQVLTAPGGGLLSIVSDGRAVVACTPAKTVEEHYIPLRTLIAKQPPRSDFCRKHLGEAITYEALLDFMKTDGDVRLLGVKSI